MATETHESTGAAEHEGGSAGLPQFDPQWWPGQIVWLLIIFVVVMTFMRVFAVPKLGGTIAARLAEQEAKLAVTTGEAEAGIAAERDRAMASVGGIASEIAQAMVQKLTGRAANAAEMAQAAKG